MAWKELYHHTVDQDTVAKMIAVRAGYLSLGEMLDELLPSGTREQARCKALAKTAFEESLMRAIQSLAMLGEPDIPKED